MIYTDSAAAYFWGSTFSVSFYSARPPGETWEFVWTKGRRPKKWCPESYGSRGFVPRRAVTGSRSFPNAPRRPCFR